MGGREQQREHDLLVFGFFGVCLKISSANGQSEKMGRTCYLLVRLEMVAIWQQKPANWKSPKQRGVEEKLALVASKAETRCLTVSLHVKQQPRRNKGFFFSSLISEYISLPYLKLLENDSLLVDKLILGMYFNQNKLRCLFRNVFFPILIVYSDQAQLCGSLWHQTNQLEILLWINRGLATDGTAGESL